MSKQTELAAALIGAGLGFDNHMCDHTDDMDCEEDIKLYSEAAYYAPIAVAMVEAAYDLTFQYPENWQWEIYCNFGEAIGDSTESESGETNDDGDETMVVLPPDRVGMLNQLEELVVGKFIDIAPPEIHQKIRDAVSQARAETA